MIRRLLVANRGEIARRIFRTSRAMGISPVAVFSDIDADAPHTAEADLGVRLAGAAPRDTYLRQDLLVKAALETRSDAIHPGYGFLSENAEFAQAVLDAGLIWVGPSPDAIATMGSKITSKQLMAKAGVPVLPELDPSRLTDADYPVLVKASAGGGGRGMRVVASPDELAGAMESARREAESAFGDPTLFCEPMLGRARHVEVQVLADGHGTVWTLGERDCSIQRRHQKIVEETPSPAVSPAMRDELASAAVAAAEAIGYVGAGTVEFLLDGDRFFFLEVNTRLQVEHPVTECVFGIDLVRHQIEIAEGERLPPDPPAARGHAIEVRLYAEDPASDWRPQSGPVHRFAVPDVDAEFVVPRAFGLRVDSSVVDGSFVDVHYDPMLAKVIAWGPSRAAAARRLANALAGASLHGLTTNRDLLVRVLDHPEFRAGEADTGFLTRHGLEVLAAPRADTDAVELSALAAALADGERNRSQARVLPAALGPWRNIPSEPQRKGFGGPAGMVEVAYRLTRAGLVADGHEDVKLIDVGSREVVFERDGTQYRFGVAAYDEGGGRLTVHVDSVLGAVALQPQARFPEPVEVVSPGSLLAPLPGLVARIAVEEGQHVEADQTLLWLEAMKMEHRVVAPTSGLVTELRVTAGSQVELGALLLVLVPDGQAQGD